MEGIGAEAVDEYELIVIVSSTYGQGDIPDDGQAFFDSLMNRNSLQGKLFTVFALGDRTYVDTFCHAGENGMRSLPARARRGSLRSSVTTLPAARLPKIRRAPGPPDGHRFSKRLPES
jgi:flavodoxin